MVLNRLDGISASGNRHNFMSRGAQMADVTNLSMNCSYWNVNDFKSHSSLTSGSHIPQEQAKEAICEVSKLESPAGMVGWGRG
jgi:trehalose utilization protein